MWRVDDSQAETDLFLRFPIGFTFAAEVVKGFKDILVVGVPVLKISIALKVHADVEFVHQVTVASPRNVGFAHGLLGLLFLPL